MKETIYNHLEKVKEILNEKEVYKFNFNISELPDSNDFSLDIRKYGKFIQLFEDLNNKQTYCLYWFECKNKESGESLVSILNVKRSELLEKKWQVPPNNNNADSTILYVGVRQGGFGKRKKISNLSGRIIQHLGYYRHGSTGALHIIQWALGQNFDLTLNVMEIGTPEEKQYLYIIEKLASIALKPLCGKH
jgi:hypothetical protein